MGKSHQRTERKNKELQFQIDEDKKNQQRMSELATALQTKIKNYKKQIEDAEEIAALNLAKFRKAQQERRRARREPSWRRLSSPTLADSSELIEHEEEYFNCCRLFIMLLEILFSHISPNLQSTTLPYTKTTINIIFL